MIGGRSVIAKTEKPQALKNIAGIIELSDGIIQRGWRVEVG